MNRYIGFVTRRPVVVLLYLLLITVLLAPGMLKLQFSNAIEAFMPKSDHEYLFYEGIKEIYGDNGRFIILSVSDGDLWRPDTLSRIDALLTDLEEYKDFDREGENGRIAKFDELAGAGDLTRHELLDAFQKDPPFHRYLERKCRVLFGESDHLGGRQLKKIRAELLKTYDFKKQEIIDEVISPLTMKDISGEDDVLTAYDIIEKDDQGKRLLPRSPEEIRTFRQRLERNPSFEGALYRRDDKTGNITDFSVMIKFINLADQDPIAREIKELIDGHHDLKTVPTGIPIINIGFHNYMHRDLYTLVPIVMLVVIIVFYFNFRSLRGVVLPFITLSLTEIWIMGLMGYLGHRISSVDLSLPPLMIAVGSSYSIHILNQYYADFAMISGDDKRKGLSRSMSHISLTVLLAGLTTFIAFITLISSEITAIRDWGFYSAVGVMFAVFISSSLIPAGLAVLPHTIPSLLMNRDKTLKTTLVDRVIALTTKAAVVHYRKVLAVVTILIIFGIAGAFRLNVETVFLNYMKEGDVIRDNATEIAEKFGGFEGFAILLDSRRPDGVKDREFLEVVERFRAWLMAPENRDLFIGRTDAFPDLVKTMHMAMNNDERTFYAIPQRQSDIIDYLEIYGGDDDDFDGRFDEFEPFVDGEFRTVNILARLQQRKDHSVGTAEIKMVSERMDQYLRTELPRNIGYTISGFPMIEEKLVHYIVTGQMTSLFLSLIIVGLIVALLFNQIKAAPLALVPMSVAVILNFGIMGWLGINLDMVTSLIAAITIGIGVDDTIHFLNTFRHNRALGLPVDETITRTLAVAGKAITFTSLALILGFMVFTVSTFIPVILFGVLMAMTMVATTVGALIVLPAVIMASGVDLKTYKSESRIRKYLDLDRLLGLEQEEEKSL
ncbi:MAG: MMPL family transporter [Deltaproteobacteria bacterium]|nr:MMPL family transporter [Deltaproteobacteria bacterium]